MNPLRAVAQVVHWEPASGVAPEFIGTCFAFRDAAHFLTAAHCIGDLAANQVAVKTPGGQLIKSALAVHRHPTADLAIVQTATLHVASDEVEPFTSIVSNWELGEEFFALGYPVDVFGSVPNQPVERLFKGYFQRFLDYTSPHGGYKYAAGEMSNASPPGLSGGPLFRPAAPSVVIALAADTLRATTYVDVLETTAAPGHIIEKHYHEVVEYGISVMLSSVLEWINEIVPT